MSCIRLINIHLVKHGKGVPLVLFHGWGFDSQIWLRLVPLLQNSCQLILVDLPGFGRSPMMDWDEFKLNLLAQLPEEFSVAGWSMGGLYATRLAIEEPLRVKALLNINSSPRFIGDEFWPGVQREVFFNFYKNLSNDINTTLTGFIELQYAKDRGESDQSNRIDFELGHLPSPEGLKSGLNILDTWDLRVGLKKLQQPACFMFGRLDPITPFKTMSAMQVEYPDFKYILFRKAAHIPFLSHTELFVTELLGFIK